MSQRQPHFLCNPVLLVSYRHSTCLPSSQEGPLPVLIEDPLPGTDGSCISRHRSWAPHVPCEKLQQCQVIRVKQYQAAKGLKPERLLQRQYEMKQSSALVHWRAKASRGLLLKILIGSAYRIHSYPKVSAYVSASKEAGCPSCTTLSPPSLRSSLTCSFSAAPR